MDRKPKLLIVEDEPALAMGLRDHFEMEGYEVASAADGEDALGKARSGQPDLILLDLMLPKLSGLEVCRTLREEGFRAPIVMLTARSEESDIVMGLDLGADDYITKPFRLKELRARVRAHLRRVSAASSEPESLRMGDVDLDFRVYRAVKAGRELALSHREFEILRYFAAHRGKTVTREELLEKVWGITHYPLTRTVDNHIAKLRQKIEVDPGEPKWIVTVHRGGYKLVG
jgi:DNA-binding response OmpR family regulator